MNFKIFAELVELKAKAASVFPFIIGMAYAQYHYREIKIGWMIFFFIAVILFNLAVDILDNYEDYHRATEGHDYKEKTNIIGRENLSLGLIRTLLVVFIGVATLMGLYMAWQTSWWILLFGVISFGVGIFYSAGPVPLSGLPVGEFLSGITMGFLIPFICIYLNVYDQVTLSWLMVGQVFLATLPVVLPIGNLLFANNICDYEEDILNGRRTLVFYVGQKRSVKWFSIVAFLPFILTILNVCLGLVPWTTLLLLLMIPVILHNVRLFRQKQIKTETFPLAIKNLMLTGLVYSLLFILGLFI